MFVLYCHLHCCGRFLASSYQVRHLKRKNASEYHYYKTVPDMTFFPKNQLCECVLAYVCVVSLGWTAQACADLRKNEVMTRSNTPQLIFFIL